MGRQTIQPPNLFPSKPWGFSQVVISPAGRICHIAGQVAWNSKQTCNAVGLEAQFRQALNHVFIGIEAAGGTPNDIQMLRIYIPNFKPGSDADVIAKVLVETFGTENPPASSWIGVQALAQPEYLVEVECVAIIKD